MIVLLENFYSLPDEWKDTNDIIILPLLNKLYFGEFEVVFFLELGLRQ